MHHHPLPQWDETAIPLNAVPQWAEGKVLALLMNCNNLIIVWLSSSQVFWVFGAIGIVGIAWATVPTLGWPWMLVFAALPATAMTFVVPVSQYQQCVLLVSDPGLYPCITTTEDSYVETSSVIAQWWCHRGWGLGLRLVCCIVCALFQAQLTLLYIVCSTYLSV